MGSSRSTRTKLGPHPQAPEYDMASFKGIKLGKGQDAWTLAVTNKAGDRFGFKRGGEFYGNVSTTREDWTEFFAKILKHPLTRYLAAHQFCEHLMHLHREPFRRETRAKLERMRGIYGPELPSDARGVVDNNRVIDVGALILHVADEGFDTGDKNFYRMKNTGEARNIEMSWEVLCEFAAWWLRDLWVRNHIEWAYVPWLVTRPNPRIAWVGNCLERTEPQSLEPVADMPAETHSAPAEVDPRTVLLACATRILEVGRPLAKGEDPLAIGLMTGLPALEVVRTHLDGVVEPAELGSSSGVGIELPADSDMDTIIGVLANSYPAVAAELVDRERVLREQEADLRRRDAALGRERDLVDGVAAQNRGAETNLASLRDSLVTDVGRLFDAEREELEALQASIRAQAKELDAAREEFGPALAELERRRGELKDLEDELALIREIEAEVAEKEKQLGKRSAELDQRELELRERDDELGRRAFDLEQRTAMVQRAEAAAGNRTLAASAGKNRKKPVSKERKKRRGDN